MTFSPEFKGNACRSVCVVLLCYIYQFLVLSSVSERLELSLARLWFLLRGDRSVPTSVTLVRFDDRSVRRLRALPSEMPGRSEILAKAIEKIAASGAKMIMMDYYFEKLKRDDPVKGRFKDALLHSPSVIGETVISDIDTDLDGKRTISNERLLPDRELADAAGYVSSLWVSTTFGVASRISVSDEWNAPNLRRVSLLPALRKFVSPTLAEPGDYDMINFYGQPFGIPDVPIYRLVTDDEPVSPDYFKDRVVLIGDVGIAGSGPRGRDDVFNVLGSFSPMWGVELHATIIANILDGSWIRRASAVVERVAMLAAVCLVSALLLWLPFRKGVGVMVALSAFWLAISYFSFTRWWVFVPGLTLFGVIFPVALLLRGVMAIWLRPEVCKTDGDAELVM